MLIGNGGTANTRGAWAAGVGQARMAAADTRGARSAGAPSAAEVASLASGLKMSTSALTSYLTRGGLLSFTADATGSVAPLSGAGALRLAGVPLDQFGTPDFDAIIAAGGKVTGTMPPAGYPKMEVLDGHRTITYSAEIEFADGTKKYVKGMSHGSDGESSAGDTFKSLTFALATLNHLPNSMEEALRRSDEYPGGLRRWLDVAL